MTAIGSSVVGSMLGSFTGFVTKQAFSYHFLTPIKDRLEDIVTKVAISKIGSFAGTLVGRETALLLSIPVTQFFADLVYGAVKTTIEAITALISRYLFPPRDVLVAKGFSHVTSGIITVVKKVISFATFFFSRAYFCHFGMPLVHEGACFLLQHCITVPALLPFAPSIVIPAIAGLVAMTIAPPITFFLGDVIGSACAELSSFTIDTAIDLIC